MRSVADAGADGRIVLYHHAYGAPGQHEFVVGPAKDASSFAANLATCMLWFLHPDHFTTTAGEGRVLSIAEMTKKMEHNGVNNRFLRELGWVRAGQGNRDAPRNSELALLPTEELLLWRQELSQTQELAEACQGHKSG